MSISSTIDMIEGVISWICLAVFIFGGFNPVYLVASGLFAVAANIWIRNHKDDKKEGEEEQEDLYL